MILRRKVAIAILVATCAVWTGWRFWFQSQSWRPVDVPLAVAEGSQTTAGPFKVSVSGAYDIDVEAPLPNPKRNPSMRWDAYVYAADPDALAVEFVEHGAAFSVPLKDTHDGLRGFEICDPDGYVLFFGRPRNTVHSRNERLAETAPQPRLLAAEPQLFVSDVGAACEFYTKKLGFAVAFVYGEPPFYGQVFRDGARLNIRHLDEPAIHPELRDREHLLSASITVDDAEALFLEFQMAGAVFHQALKTEPWGARTFIVRDPDGNLILFAGGGE